MQFGINIHLNDCNFKEYDGKMSYLTPGRVG